MERSGSVFRASVRSAWWMEAFAVLHVHAAAECTENCSRKIQRSELFGSECCGGQKVGLLPVLQVGGNLQGRCISRIFGWLVSASFAAPFGGTSRSLETLVGTRTPGASFPFT